MVRQTLEHGVWEKPIGVSTIVIKFVNFVLNLLVKITAEIKKNTALQNVAPGTYESSMKHKR